MSWIKRNLFFVIGSVVALALMGLAGYFLYSKWQSNNQVQTDLAADYEKLKRLKSQNPHPGDAKVNNIDIAREHQKQISNFVYTARAHFVPIQRIPSEEDEPKVTDQGFTRALSRTIDQLQKQATNASVILPPNYSFSFEAEKNKLSFAVASLMPLSAQLGEVKSLCDILFAAKINSLDNIRRERVAAEDSGPGGLQTDYHTDKTTTNELAAVTTYEVAFKCFSSELGQVLAGLASSPHGFIVKTINVEAAPISQAVTDQFIAPVAPVTPMYVQPQPIAQPNPAAESAAAAARFASRYGIRPGGNRYGGGAVMPPVAQPYVPPPTYAPQPGAAPKSTALPTVLDERQLKVTINLALVKLLPTK